MSFLYPSNSFMRIIFLFMETFISYLRSFNTCLLALLIVHCSLCTGTSKESSNKSSISYTGKNFLPSNIIISANTNRLPLTSSGKGSDSDVSFTEMTDILLTRVSSSSVAWGDYDKDGDLDILLTGIDNSSGQATSKVFRNDGNNTFTEQTSISLKGVGNSSVVWGDYDNDGYLDILLSGLDNTGPICKIYRNNKNNTFTELSAISFSGVSGGSVQWGDYDNDGDLDILLAGRCNSGPSAKIYRNDGNDIFTEQSSITLAGIYNGSAQWGDYDNDGDLDILITGDSYSGSISKIYRNDGNNTFTEQTSISLMGVYAGSVAWGDYNNDGFLDILLTGNSNYGTITKIYKNNGNNTFTEQSSISFTGIYYGSVAWGDYDNDGDLDILLTGETGGIPYNVSKIYQNNGNNTFTEQSNILLSSVGNSSAEWGDYDNDGDLDILLTGNGLSRIYRNESTFANSAPNIPTGLTNVITGKNVTLSWTSQGDSKTPTLALTYNVRVGTTPGGSQIVSPNALSNGKLTVPAMGNAQLGTTFNLKNLKMGTYYWSVQAVDNGYKGSAFASEGTFTLVTAEPTILINTASNITLNGATLSGMVNPNNATATVTFEYGTTTGVYNNWKSVEASPTTLSGIIGLSVSTSLTGLISGTTYYFRIKAVNSSGTTYSSDMNFLTPPMFTEMTDISISGFYSGSAAWGDYNNDGNLDLVLSGPPTYNSPPVTKIYKNNGNNSFTELTSISMTGVSYSSIQLGDYDNDGDLDLLLAGTDKSGPVCKIYRNDGNDIFTEQSTIILPGITQGSVVWGDYDNDGDLDILITGSSSSGYITKLYRNNGNNSFTAQTSIALPGVINGSAKWVDCDNDGYLDIFLTGDGYSQGLLSKIYHNNGDNTFYEPTGITLTGLTNGSADWGDYDNDGDLDLLITGRVYSSATYISKMYRNEGNNTFTEQSSISLTGVSSSSVQWGDYDNDGNLDILIAGESNGSPSTVTKIYRNNGNNTFTEQTNMVLPGVSSGIVTWGDFDNDGDLDILLSGNQFSKIYRNNCVIPNSVPSAPTSLKYNINGKNVILSWTSQGDKETPTPALTCNVRVGTTPGGSQIVSPHTLRNGKLTIPAMGNAQLGTIFILNNLPFKIYYWSVQSVDNGYRGGSYSTEGSFKIGPDVNTLYSQTDSPTSVTLFGNVDPKGFDLTTLFSYGLSKSTMKSSKSVTQTISSSGGLQNVSAPITGLTPGVTYYYQLNVYANGDIASGDTNTFNTGAPMIISVNADNITTNSVRLISVVNPNNSTSTVAIEYGSSTNLGQIINSPSIISGNTDQQVVTTINSLTKNTIYYYRVKTTNAIGTNYSSINQFITQCDDNILSAKPTGSISVCQGTVQTTYTTSSLSALSYIWEILPATAATIAGTGVTGTVTWNPLYTGSAQVRVRGENGTCQSVWTQQLQIDVKPGLVSTTISGLEPVCKGQDNCEYSISPVNGIMYSWNVSGGTIKEGSGSTNVKVQWSATPDTGYVYLTQTLIATGCSLTDRKTVTKNEYTPPFSLGIKKKGSINLLICLSPDMSGYQWYLNNEVISGATEQYYAARTKYGSYSVKITDKHGCFCFSNPESVSAANALSIYPNPSHGEIKLKLDCEQKGDVVIKVVDSYGVVRYTGISRKDESTMTNQITLPVFPRGTYILEIEINGEKIESSKILIL